MKNKFKKNNFKLNNLDKIQKMPMKLSNSIKWNWIF